MPSFFSRLSYSFGNEDPGSEDQALSIKPEDRVICITASGDRPLHHSLKNSKEIVSLDANPAQNHLLELKMAAMRDLNYHDYLAFLGARPAKNRKETFKQISKHMSPASIVYWQKNLKAIDAGVLYQGVLEKRLKLIAKLVCCLRGRFIKRLFSFEKLEDQLQFLQKEWHCKWWRGLIERIVLHPKSTRVLIGDPGLYAHRHPSINAGKYILDRLTNGLEQHLANKNIFLSLFLKGRVEADAFPPYLSENGFHQIKKHVTNIKPHTSDLISYLENAPDNHFDCFSLSDVASYISAEDFKRLVHAVYRTAKPGARFCFREFLSKHQIPKPLDQHFMRNPELEKKLEKEDRCLVYRFMVGSINKAGMCDSKA